MRWPSNVRPSFARPAILLLAHPVFFCLHRVPTHSYLSVPVPMSRMTACRVGGWDGWANDCPGPCPNADYREDAGPANPSATYRRGESYEIEYTRNNHFGGFRRFTLVPVKQMWDWRVHKANAFSYACWSRGEFECSMENQYRSCWYDMDSRAYKDWITIPAVFPDGDYVLGYAWYGGGERFGNFGDYYDCAYVRVEGGAPVVAEATPTFTSGESNGNNDGKCEATVNDLGICRVEPCIAPSGEKGYYTKRMKPAQFDGTTPPPIKSSSIQVDNRADVDAVGEELRGLQKYTQSGLTSKEDAHGALTLGRMRLVEVKSRREVPNVHRPIDWTGGGPLTIEVEAFGPVSYVEFLVNGRRSSYKDYKAPYTIGGDFKDPTVDMYYPWMFHYKNKNVRVTAHAVGPGKAEAWKILDLVIYDKNRGDWNRGHPGIGH